MSSTQKQSDARKEKESSTKLTSPSAERNRGPILQVIQDEIVVKEGEIIEEIEIGSGTGQQVSFWAEQLPQFRFQPTEYNEDCVRSINEYCSGLDNVNKAFQFDVTDESAWGEIEKKDLIICTNVVHISPFQVTESLFKFSDHILKDTGKLILYGPFFENDVETAESNLKFDTSLQSRDSSWGIRHLQDQILPEAEQNGLQLGKRIEMPANNLCLIFQRK